MSETTQFTLKQTSREFVEDKGGIWVFISGDLLRDGKREGIYYATNRSIKNSSPDFDVSRYTLNLFFKGADPPENMTLQGVWSPTGSGRASGSISAASMAFIGAVGVPFVVEGDALNIYAAWN